MTAKKAENTSELERTVKLLIVTNKFSEDHQKKIHRILETTASVCNTTVHAIIHDPGRGRLTDARHLCFYFFRNEMSLSLTSIQEIFLNKRPGSKISIGIKRIVNLDPKSKPDSQMIEKREQIQLELKTK